MRRIPLGTLKIRKVDSETKEPLPDAVFELYDRREKSLGEYNTDSDGVTEIPKKLKSGIYRIKEIKAPSGYMLDGSIRTVEIQNGEISSIEIPNVC